MLLCRPHFDKVPLSTETEGKSQKLSFVVKWKESLKVYIFSLSLMLGTQYVSVNGVGPFNVF